MLRPRHTYDEEADPAVIGTVARLRLSIYAVVAGSVAFFVLGVAAVRSAWLAGVAHGGETTSSMPEGPTLVVFAVVGVSFIALASVLVLVVRAPFDRARSQARDLVDANRRLQHTTLETYAALSAAVEARDRYTAGHALRVTLVSILIGQELGLDEHELDVLRQAATFHDIGKIAVPDTVLRHSGRLSDGEFEAMKVHAAEGARICSKLHTLRESVPIIRSHHERVDGRGYPDALVGDAIPLGARIIAVADAWDAITSDRPYRTGEPAFVALEEIRRCSGTQFDEPVVRAFIEVLAKDPWMFGLTPEDVADRRPLPMPASASRGVEHLQPLREDPAALVDRVDEAIDWESGFDDEDARAA